MGIICHPNHTDVDWQAKVPIGPYIGAFNQYLTERRYASSTFAGYMVCITHFARRMRTKRLRLHRIDEVSVAQFLDDHLPKCQCSAPVRRDRGEHGAALGHLLVVLRSLGAISRCNDSH